MPYTEFCSRSGGSNLNAGTVDGTTATGVPSTVATVSDVGGTWVNATRTYTMQSLSTTGIVVGMWVSVYITSGATVATYIAKITTVGATTFVTSATLFMGTVPADGASTMSAKIGGAWAGPSSAVTFPWTMLSNAAVNATAQVLRYNMKNDQSHSMNASSTLVTINNGPFVVQGFTTIFGDFGRTTITGPASGTSAAVINSNASTWVFADLIITNNGSTGTAQGISLSTNCLVIRCSVSGMRGNGVTLASNGACAIETEAYGNNLSNTGNTGGFGLSGGTSCYRCVSHDNTGSGFNLTVGSNTVVLVNCIGETNTVAGINISAANSATISGCDVYNNVNGIAVSGAGRVYIENCNIVKNSTAGINVSGVAIVDYWNCAFPAAGTTANGADLVETNGANTAHGSLTIVTNTTPWTDPDNGDFRLKAGGIGLQAGRGTFTELATSYAGTVGYPDVGAAQAIASSGSSINTGIRSGGRL